MKLKNLLFIGLASAVLLAGCKKDEVQESPSLTINEDSASLQFSAQGGESETQTITFTANRSWTATCDADWVHMDPVDGPASSDPQTLTVYVDQNDGFVRPATITLTAGGVVNKTVSVSQDGKEIEYTSIADLRAMAKDTQTPVKIEGSVFIKGVVISDKDELNNISEKNVFIQDETAGIQLRFASAGTYSRGDELSIDATGLTIAFYGDMYQLVASSSYNESEEKWESTGMPATAVTRLSEDNEIVAKQITLQDLLGLKYESQYVEITTPVQVSEEDLGKTFVVGNDHTNIKFTDADYNTFVVRSEKYSDLLKETDVPEGSGLIKGIATRYGATPQIVFSTVSDWSGLTDARFDVDAPDPAPDNAVYYNDFDKEAATKSYGSTGDRWPYLDQFDGWMNETGTGVENVSYDYSGASARNNSNTDGSYSDYPGSGLNNILFGSDAYLQINNITVDAQNYTLSFGTEKYAYGVSDNTFKPEEFHVYISDNGERWVELEYAFPNGFKNGRWDLASSTFTIPSGTSALYIHFASDLSDAHRLDDVALAPAESAGTEIDFSKGTAIGGGDEPGPVEEMTIAEVYSAEEGADVKTSGTVVATYANGFLISDTKDMILVYQSFNPESVPSVGDVVTVSGVKANFGGMDQIGVPVEYEVTGNESVEHPSPAVYEGAELDGISDEYERPAYIQYSGKLNVSGNYYNVIVSGASVQGSVAYPDDELKDMLAGMNGEQIVVTGYYIGTTGSGKYVSTMAVSVERAAEGDYLNVSNDKISVQATDESATINVQSNVAWTASCETEGFTVADPASGNGNGTVTVEFAANTDSNPRTATVTISATEADVEPVTVTITQAAAGASELEVLTVEEFLAKPEGDTYYQLTGTVANISNTYFGNFDLIDETGSVYVYGLVSSEGAADGTFESLGLKEGDVVTIAGRRASYKGDPQVGDAYYISHVEGQLPEIKDVSVTEFLSSPISELQKYRLTGTIENLTNTTFGNFDLVDETGSVYVYGLKKDENASNQSFSELGLKEGDVVTLVGTRGEHNGDPQVANAYYESHVEGLSFSVSPASLSASAEAGTAKFTVTASDEVSWTVSTASDFVILSDQSGTGTKEIEVTYTANDGADSRTAEITVSTTADVPTKSYTVVLTQNAAGAAESQWTLVSDTSELSSGDYVILCDFNNVSGQSGVWALSNAEGTTKGSVKATDISTIGMSENSNVLNGVTEGYIWTFTQSGDGYTLRPKNNDTIGLGVIADNNGLRNAADYKDQVWSLAKVSGSWGWEMTSQASDAIRYLCGYAPDNWRTYKGISNCNTKNWEIRIYKLN